MHVTCVQIIIFTVHSHKIGMVKFTGIVSQDWDGQIYKDSLTGLERPEDDLIGWFIGLQCF